MSFSKSKKYWIIPRASLSPNDLVLGNVLPRADDPVGCLNRHAVEMIDARDVVEEREQLRNSFREEHKNGFGLKVEVSSALAPLVGLSPTAEATQASYVSTGFEATKLQARHFSPSEDYVNRALRVPAIDDYVRRSWFSAPIYMVVGVAIASKASRAISLSRDIGGKLGAGISLSGSGTGISAEASANRGLQSTYHDTVESDFVFAYRVRRFRYKRMKDEFVGKSEDETRHALYGTDEAEADSGDDSNGHEVAVFTYFEGDDISAAEADVVSFEECEP